ncbi:hypothetical protein ACFC1B_06915 [Streptomyces xiamenensis]|uniref:DUF6197 family protein n=1 Tax=Streptomyces xiamenensis TaxID=408015 RepID=UPI0035E297F5
MDQADIDTAIHDLLAGAEHHLASQRPVTPPSEDLVRAEELLREDPVRSAHLWTYDGQQVRAADIAGHIEEALGLFRREGWTRRHFVVEGRCIQGALQDAQLAGHGTEATAYVSRSVMRWLLHTRGLNIDTITFNDRRAAAQADVEALFADAANFARHYGPI